MKILLIHNPFANGGRSKQVLKKVELFLQNKGLEWDCIQTPDHAALPAPLWENYTKLVLIGGDGSLHRLLNFWGIPTTPLCLISAGSGNDFSRLSHGSSKLDIQLNHILNGSVQACDLGQCNGIWFATGVGIGFDGKVAEILQKNSPWKSHLAYMFIVILQVFRYREKWIRIEHDQGIDEGASLLFTVGNGAEFGGGFKVTPLASFTDGVFQCCWIKKVNLIQRILHLSKVEKGQHEHLPFVRMLDSVTLKLYCDEILTCHMDGEVYRWDTFMVEMNAGVLELIVSPDTFSPNISINKHFRQVSG